MGRKRQPLTALVLGALGMVGLAVVATVPADRPAAAAQAAAVQPKPAGADAGAPDLYARAKQAYKEGRRLQALTDAVEAHKKDPQDVRVKYLIYLLRQGTTTTTGTGTETPAPPVPGGRKAVTISDEEVQGLIKEEGTKAIRQFAEIQRILQRRCGDAQCHGATGTGAKWALALKGPANQERMLADNFRTVNRYINRETLDQSPLLLKPLGGKEAGHPAKAIRGKTDPAYQQILKYIGTLRTVTQKGGFWKSGETGTPP